MNLIIPQRLKLMRLTLIFSLCLSILFSFPLWLSNRYFPMSGLEGIPPVQAPFDYVVVILALLFAVAALFLRFPRTLICLSILTLVYLVICDINRLQPWLYVYTYMLLVFVLHNGRVDDSNKYTSYFIILQIIPAAYYFFTGLNQLNPDFMDSVFADVISPIRNFTSERQFIFLKKFGVVVPYLLMATGLGLIITPLRYLAVSFAVLMHLVLIILLFPGSKNKDYSLWFSNISFMAMLFILFSGRTKQNYFSPTFLFQIPLFYVVIVLFVVMPWFNGRGRWPDFLSFNHKSGNNYSAVIRLQKKEYERLPVYVRVFCDQKDGAYEVNYRAWALSELHVECFYSQTVFKSIYRSVGGNSADVKEVEMQMFPKKPLLRKP